VILGQVCRTVRPVARTASHYKRPLSVVVRLLILAVMLKAGVEVRDRLADGPATVSIALLPAVAAACVGIHLMAFLVAFSGGRFFGFDRPKRIAAAMAGSQKTLPVSLILFDAYFTGYPLAVVPVVLYHFGQLIADTALADMMHRRACIERSLEFNNDELESIVVHAPKTG
jgi:sodium/bile acid cotransporter 7